MMPSLAARWPAGYLNIKERYTRLAVETLGEGVGEEDRQTQVSMAAYQ